MRDGFDSDASLRNATCGRWQLRVAGAGTRHSEQEGLALGAEKIVL